MLLILMTRMQPRPPRKRYFYQRLGMLSSFMLVGNSIKGDICGGSAIVPPELENSFDFILMTDVLEHLPDDQVDSF